MSEICQSCSKTIEVFIAQERVSFTVIGGITRSWVMCKNCAAKLQEMVLGYMGELPPNSVGEPNGTGWGGDDYSAWFDGELPFAEEPEPCHCGLVL